MWLSCRRVVYKCQSVDRYLAKTDPEKRAKFMAFERGELSAEEILGLLDEVFKPEIDMSDLENAVFSRFMGIS